MSDELRGRTFATLYTVIRLCLLLSLTISPLFADLCDWLFGARQQLAARPARRLRVQLPGRAARALGRRRAHDRRRASTRARQVAALPRRARRRRRRRPGRRARHRTRRRAASDVPAAGRGARHDRAASWCSRAATARGRRRSARGSSTRCASAASTWSRPSSPAAPPLGRELRRLLLDGGAVDAARRGAAHGGRPRRARRHRDPAGAGSRRVGRERPPRAVVARVPGRRPRARRRRGRGARRRSRPTGSSPISCSCSTSTTRTAESRRRARARTGSNARAARSTPRCARPTGTWPARYGWTVVDGTGASGRRSPSGSSAAVAPLLGLLTRGAP